jgi:hypothetical protein
MRYYFTTPEMFLESLQNYKTKDYTLLYNWFMAPFNQKVNYHFNNDSLVKEYNFFILESCRFFIDGKDYDKVDMEVYYDLIKKAQDNLLIDRGKVENYFKEYINDLFSSSKGKKDKLPPTNISEVVIDLMLSELSMNNILERYVNLTTQDIDLKSVQDAVKLEKINFIKRLIHDRVLFFIEYYRGNMK